MPEPTQPSSFVFDAQTVAAWADLSSDHNPLHLDPAFAAQTTFGVPIVHGHLLACVVADRLQRRNGASLGVSIRFTAPVPVGRAVQLVEPSDESASPGIQLMLGDLEPLRIELVDPR